MRKHAWSLFGLSGLWTLGALFIGTGSFSLRAETSDEIAALAQKGIGEERHPAGFRSGKQRRERERKAPSWGRTLGLKLSDGNRKDR